jgi:hypothetical protein
MLLVSSFEFFVLSLSISPASNRDLETQNTKHETRNTKPETQNPKPETYNYKLRAIEKEYA